MIAASKEGHVDVVAILLEHAAKYNIPDTVNDFINIYVYSYKDGYPKDLLLKFEHMSYRCSEILCKIYEGVQNFMSF